MATPMMTLVLIFLCALVQAELFLNMGDGKMMPTREQYGNYIIVPDEIDKLKRSLGRNCMFTISGCFTSSQAERYRKYMENVRFIPK